MCDLFIILEEIDFASYADDKILSIAENVVSSLESCTASLFEWFSSNLMKANPEKCHLLMNVNRPATIKIGKYTISNGYCEKLLGVKIDSQLNFNNHLETIIKKTSEKLHVLARFTPYMCSSKRKLLMNAFLKAQFCYCPLVWMCHSCSINNKINKLHETCLSIIYNDKEPPFVDLLAKDGSVTIHTRNLQFLPLKCLRYIRTCQQY